MTSLVTSARIDEERQALLVGGDGPAPSGIELAGRRALAAASEVVGDSPVVPDRTRPSQPWATRCAARRWAPSRSSAPSAVKGGTMAHRARPKGGGVVVMGVVSALRQ